MPLPSIIDTAQTHLFTSVDRLRAEGVPEVTINRLLRLRDAYSYWLQFPNKKDREIVAYIQKHHGVSQSPAYEDLKVIKYLLGSIQKTSKDYHRYRFLERLNLLWELAYNKGDIDQMTAILDRYAKYTQLDKEDQQDVDWSLVVPAKMDFTNNPDVLGYKRIPNIKERIAALKERYFTDDVKEVDYEEIDFDEDSLYKPAHINADGSPKHTEGIS